MNRSSILIIILIAALLVRITAVPIGLKLAKSRGDRFSDEYGGIAKNIAEGKGYAYDWFGELHPTSIHPPVYPYLLAALFMVFGQGQGGVLATICLNVLLSILLLHLVFKSSEHFFGTLPSMIILCILAFYPPQLYSSVTGLPTILYAVLLFVTLLLAWRLKENLSIPAAIFWGLSLGLCALSYSFVLVLSPFLALWIVIAAGRPRIRKALGLVALAALVAVTICLPWTIRNYHIHERWFPIRDQAGSNLWWGNGPYATGGVVDTEGNYLGSPPKEIADILRSIPNEVDGDRYLKKLAIEHMKRNPGRTVRLWMSKLSYFWWFGKQPIAKGSGMGKYLPILKVLKAALLIAAAFGFILLWQRDKSLVVLGLLVCLALSTVFMIFHSGRLRYFVPLEPIMAIAAGYAITRGIERLRPQRTGRPRRNTPSFK